MGATESRGEGQELVLLGRPEGNAMGKTMTILTLT
jgi:hypothetical protein